MFNKKKEFMLEINLLSNKIRELENITQSQKRELEWLKEDCRKRDLRMAGDDETTKAVINDITTFRRQIKEIAHWLKGMGAGISEGSQFNMLNKVTNSQAGEDSILAYIVANLKIPFKECTYLDLGANHPVEMSNTYFFYTQGARGVLVEANEELIPELQNFRREDIILNNCVAPTTGEKVKFSILNIDGLSFPGEALLESLESENSNIELKKTIEIETISVNDIIKNYFIHSPIIMNVDIEGKELEVLQSIDWEQYRPLLIVVEVIPYSQNLSVGIKNEKIIAYLEQQEYIEYAFTGVNSIFIDRKKIETYNFITYEKQGKE